jgi:hypothetical protein
MPELSSKIKKELRDYYGFETIKDAYTIFGVNNADDAYKALNKEYEKEQKRIVKEQAKENVKKNLEKIVREQKKKEEEKKKRKEENKLKMPISKLETFVNKWYGNKKGHFQITLKSMIADVRRTFKFNHINQFNNWIKKLTEEKEINSDGLVVDKDEYDIFSRFKVENIKLISGGCNYHASKSIELKSSFYKYKLFNPSSRDNNCFFACLNHIKSLGSDRYIYNNLRKQFGLEKGKEITISDAYKIANELEYNIQIIDYDTNEELEDNIQYIVLGNNHYYVLESYEQIVLKEKKTKRGLLTFDFETRPTEEYDIIKKTKRGLSTFDFETRPTEEYDIIKTTNEKLYILKDTLCCVYYRKYKQEECENIKFITNDDKSSARQLIDWFNQESKNGRTYNVIAHNGGRFDYYFFISALNDKELLECDIHFRGTTIISINYRGHLFKDSACFLTDSLKNLSKSFKISDGKITKFNLHGLEITSEQLCFYKHYLTFKQFLDLQHNDKEFWDLYEKYCLYDCIALFQIWEKFTECVNSLIEKINPYLLSKCPLMSSTTIGSHSKKIIVEVNKYGDKVNKYKRDLEIFTGINYVKVEEKFVKQIDYEKYNFLCNFKRGGISHSHKMGKHMSGITGVDIASQYPASLIYSMIPTGKSSWTDEYDENKHGFYLIENLVFNSYKLKPVALGIKNESLNWGTNDMKELYVDSYMLKYIINNYGLESFNVVKGLVSDNEIESRKIFGKYIETFYDEKKQQDKYKSEKNELYNEALRSTIKLYLNSLTGKLVENPAIHFSVKFDNEGTKSLNGQGITKTTNEDKINDWLVAGIMVYSYSKRLLFEYIRCLPNNSDDVIHIETDGIYFSTRHLDAFTKNLEQYKGDYPCMFGEDLGNLKIEKTTYEGQVAYFLGKKFYCITMNDDYNNKPRDEKDKNIYRIKGFPQKTINADGSDKYLVDVSLYEDAYNGKEITRSFQTLKKSLFCEKTRITAYTMTRTIKGNNNYKLYE